MKEVFKSESKHNDEMKDEFNKVEKVIKTMERIKASKSLKVHRTEFDIVDWRFDLPTLLNNLNWFYASISAN